MRKRAISSDEKIFSEAMLQEEHAFSWSEQRVRFPFHAGVVYPRQRQRLERWLKQILSNKSDVGKEEALPIFSVDRAHPSFPSKGKVKKTSQHDGPRILMAPHLDFRVEVDAYARVYRSLAGEKPDRVILLGTGHQVVQGFFCLTDKDFATPLGISPCDREVLEEIRSRARTGVLSPHDGPHREEHALEFQLLFLQHLYGCDVPIVPILCGSFAHYFPLQEVQRAAHLPGVMDVLETLSKYMTSKTLIVLGVDLTHIGWKFGHASTARSLWVHAVEHERRLLGALCEGDAVAFWQEGRRLEDAFHVCGFSSIACLLELFPALRGEVLRHDMWMEWETSSAVGFASLRLFPMQKKS